MMSIPPLYNGEVHVYKYDFRCYEKKMKDLFEILKPEEKERALRYRNEHDKKRFIVGRGKLRELLSIHLSLEPQKIEITLSKFGKPFLVNHPNLFFNVSHSGNKIMIAISLDNQIGIDIEMVDLSFSIEEVINVFLSENEINALTQGDFGVKLLYKIWVRKEACLKAWGVGLNYPPIDFSVPLSGLVRKRLINTRLGNCYLNDIIVDQQYVASLAMYKMDNIIEITL